MMNRTVGARHAGDGCLRQAAMLRAHGALLLVFVAGPALAATLPESSAEKHMGVATCASSQCHG